MIVNKWQVIEKTIEEIGRVIMKNCLRDDIPHESGKDFILNNYQHVKFDILSDKSSGESMTSWLIAKNHNRIMAEMQNQLNFEYSLVEIDDQTELRTLPEVAPTGFWQEIIEIFNKNQLEGGNFFDYFWDCYLMSRYDDERLDRNNEWINYANTPYHLPYAIKWIVSYVMESSDSLM